MDMKTAISCIGRTLEGEPDVRTILPLHCTGPAVVCRMRSEIGDKVRFGCTGDTIGFS